MSLKQHAQRAQFTRQRQQDEAIKQAYAESIQREAAWVKMIMNWRMK